MDLETSRKNEDLADSPTSVLGDEEICNEENGDGSDGVETGDSSKMVEEGEEKLQETDVKEVEEVMNDTKFNKLDELLSQTQLYSEFLLEKMEDITFNGAEEVKGEEEEKEEDEPVVTKKRGRKRKAGNQFNTKKAQKAVAAMLSSFDEGAEPEDGSLTVEQRVEKEQAKLVPLLTGGTLKPYQIKGVKWMISLWQNGLNGILADQMGLGKTIQTIGFLAHLKGKGMHGPYLVIAPLSTLSNWANEISRFTPSINAVVYHGNGKARDEIRRKQMSKTIGPKFPIVITSYEIAMNDARRFLRKYSWKYVVVDEGHRLKNTKCKLLKELKYIPMENKLLLTGTPLQNNLAELWSLLNFLLPDIFNSHEEFESWFDLSGKCSTEAQKEELEERRRAQVVAKLHAILRPFLLRRLKSDVELTLPRKKEIILYATMTDHQKKLQEHLINKTFETHMAEEKGEQNVKGKLRNLFLQLRKNCYHPDLLVSNYDITNLYPPIQELVEQCGKFRLLDRLMEKLLARKHKVLIFSQWTKMLDLIDYYLSEKGHQVCRIDGSVHLDERKRQIQEFNDINSSYRIFILSTRAGGLGINLTSADTCILYDSDWNPQADLQAMDRCHRIGQTRPVHVYRLATAQSVEGRLLKRAFSKLKLEHVVIGKGQFQQERTSTSLEAIEEYDILALLQDVEDPEELMIQTDISDENIDRVMDRTDLIAEPKSEEGIKADTGLVVPLKGPGWEVILPVAGGGMLSTLNS